MSLRQDDFIDIHDRLLAGDETASSSLVLEIGPRVEGVVASRHPEWRGTDELHDAVVDALFDHIRYPRKFNQSKGTLLAYLSMAANRDLLNRMPAASRRMNIMLPLEEVVELADLPRNVLMKDDEGEDSGRPPSLPPELELDEKELKVFRLMGQGERSTEVFADALGLGDLPLSETRKEVKRFKDRLKKRIERSGGTLP